ncbi:MAG: MFS transporter [Agathobacter sp.]|nr:MFS transporter [Agathobacter sp.]
MHKKKERRRKLTISILSLSLLTVMAGAAVAPALNVIKEHFCDVDQALVQMIISIPALFIFLTNMIFPKLCKVFRAKELTLAGLIIYVIGGCAAGLFNNIWVVLFFRALVGVGVGIIMPMSTGLLSFYYTRDKQDKLMGYSSAMNQMGGVIATLISGLLAAISWRASFMVYLMGLMCIILCALFLPNEKIAGPDNKRESGVFKRYYPFVIAMFLLMFTFFVYPSTFAIETAKEAVIPMQYVAVIMAAMDLVAFFGGLAFVHIKKQIGVKTKYVAPVLFLAGYLALLLLGGWPGAIIGSAFIGFANGLGIPFIMSTAGQTAGRAAATTVMPMLSMALYLAQFTTPMILSILGDSPYLIAACSAALFVIWSHLIKIPAIPKEAVHQES